MIAQRYRHEFGLKDEQLGTIATTFRHHATLNANAHYNQPMTMEDYLSARWVAEPFRLFDCCPVTDGAAAVIVTSTERARDLKKTPVHVMGFGQGHPAWDLAQREVWTTSGAAISGPAAFQMAGITVEDVDFAELYDCFTIVPIVTLEDYGFCKKGEGPDFIGGGRIGLGGESALEYVRGPAVGDRHAGHAADRGGSPAAARRGRPPAGEGPGDRHRQQPGRGYDDARDAGAPELT